MVAGGRVPNMPGLTRHTIACRPQFLGSSRGQPPASHLCTADVLEDLGAECIDTICFTWCDPAGRIIAGCLATQTVLLKCLLTFLSCEAGPVPLLLQAVT